MKKQKQNTLPKNCIFTFDISPPNIEQPGTLFVSKGIRNTVDLPTLKEVKNFFTMDISSTFSVDERTLIEKIFRLIYEPSSQDGYVEFKFLGKKKFTRYRIKCFNL